MPSAADTPSEAVPLVGSRPRGASSVARVLVADDDVEMRRLVADAMRKDGHEVVEASEGCMLLAQAMSAHDGPENQFDLLISDIRMPVFNGLAVLDLLRKKEWTVPVILMTAFGDDETRARAVGLGAILFDKPFSIDDLRATVRKLLARAV